MKKAIFILALAAAWNCAAFALAPADSVRLHRAIFKLGGDSVVVEYARPNRPGRFNSVLVLPDRFGVNLGSRQLIQSLAGKGVNAYVMHIRSVAVDTSQAYPEVHFDSSDIRLANALALEIVTDSATGDRIAVIGMDVGADIALKMVTAIPMFSACIVFYPTLKSTIERDASNLTCPIYIHVAELDGEFNMARANNLKEILWDNGKKGYVNMYKQAKRFFFNPLHRNYHPVNSVQAWASILQFLRSRLR